MEDAERELNCTVRKDPGCGTCGLGKYLNCRWDKRILNGFLAAASGLFIGTFIILALIWLYTAHYWPLVLYIILLFTLFGYEIKFLCSHCPFYAGEGRTLKCLANNGMPKIFRYNPAPMTGPEKFMVRFLIAVFLVIYPAVASAAALWLTISGNHGIITLTAIAGVVILLACAIIAFYQVLRTFFCRMCVNFSCPFNTVEKRIVDEYLMNNDIMREAWEKSGYKLG